MKCLLVFLISFVVFTLKAQYQKVPQTSQPAISMSSSVGKNIDGIYRYYERGKAQPYTGVLYAKFPNGYYQSWQDFENGIGQGTWINYYENGHLKEVGTYDQNKVEGPIKKYHPNGQLAASGTYREWRVRVGKWNYFDINGQFLKTENYGQKGDFREVEGYYQRGEISKRWYDNIISKKE